MTQPQSIKADLKTLQVDTIVNMADTALTPVGGVCGASHRPAGQELAEVCRNLGGCDVGDAKITLGCALRTKYVIHTVGPIYDRGEHGEAELLDSSYRRCLEFAHEYGLNSIAIPCISTGIFEYPQPEAASIAIKTTSAWSVTAQEPWRIVCCCFADEDVTIYRVALTK